MVWAEPYLQNQFPYIKKFKEDLNDKEYSELKNIFKTKFMGYKKTKDKVFN